MINLLLGAPGGGKSYEATVFHILPALEMGRKVITNLPLNVEAFAAIDASFRQLIEVRNGPSFGSPLDGSPLRMFSHVADYSDPWRHPQKGFGPLFVIDECHFPLPDRDTRRDVEEWFSMHRHFNVDVLLITQSYGKISSAIRDLVQIVYRVRKNVALGAPSSYTRKVQDGIRGEVMNTSIRRYEKRYFGLYRSHTQGQAVNEFNASDVRPLWKHWSFIGAGICFSTLAVMALTGNLKTPFSAVKTSPVRQSAVSPGASVSAPSPVPPGESVRPVSSALPGVSPSVSPGARDAAPSHPVLESKGSPEPFEMKGIHLTGSMISDRLRVYVFVISQNGQPVSTITDRELVQAGYTFTPTSACVGVLEWQGKARAVTCDLPSVQVPMAGASVRSEVSSSRQDSPAVSPGASSSVASSSV